MDVHDVALCSRVSLNLSTDCGYVFHSRQLLSVYGDFDWFEEVTLDHFR